MTALELECLYDANGMVGSEMVLEREGYSMEFPSHGNGIGMEPIYHTLEWVTGMDCSPYFIAIFHLT